ncbi:MAG: hypothetical protein ABR541_09085 [Candidatus Dormibacteria bacterium]
MAAAAPFVKLLRQLSDAQDDYRSGALDITWDGGRATLYVVFGQPNHAVYAADGSDEVEGPEAIAALLHHLPPKFKLSPWRNEVVRTESVQMTMTELIEPFAQLSGVATAEPVAPQAGEALNLDGAAEDEYGVPFGLRDFPLLPVGESLWADGSAAIVHLDQLLPQLPDCLVVLTGARLRAAAVVVRGSIVDAVWVDDEDRASGESAAMALIGAREGRISGYRMDDPTIAEALTLLWRCPVAYDGLPLEWLEPRRFLAHLAELPGDRVVSVNSSRGFGVGLYFGGRFVAAYTDQRRVPSDDPAVLAALFDAEEGTVSVQQRAGNQPVGGMADEHLFHMQVDSAPAVAPAEQGPPAWLVAAEASGALQELATSAPVVPVAVAADAWDAGPDAGPDPGDDPDLEDGLQDGARLELDFEGIKAALVEIGVRWLGPEDVAPVAAVVRRARHRVADIIAAVETVKTIPVPGREPGDVQGMAKEMHWYAAEALCGA